MKRRKFTTTCLSCLSASLSLPLVAGCQSTHYATGALADNGLVVEKTEFTYRKKDHTLTRDYIIVRNDALEFPIYLYRFSEDAYSALLMKCTHQGNELGASGDHLVCPAHGSEFTNKGLVSEGPAEEALRSFKVHTSDDKIFIDLRV